MKLKVETNPFQSNTPLVPPLPRLGDGMSVTHNGQKVTRKGSRYERFLVISTLKDICFYAGIHGRVNPLWDKLVF